MQTQCIKTNFLSRGFTLIEIMVVIAIIGLLLAVVAPNIIGRSDDAKIVKAGQDVHTISMQLDLYYLDNGFFPSQAQGLTALIERPTTPPEPARWKDGGYLKKLPLDPWGNPYQYRYPGTHGKVDVYSFGPHGEEATGDEKAEIGNW